MKEHTSETNQTTDLKPYLSPLAVWALSVGSAIGWGSLVYTLQTIKTRESDHHHVVIGVRPG